MLPRCLAYAVVIVCSSAASQAFAQAQPRATVELFTSQGCSSCPPADKLLGELAADRSLVAISVPIDYWDYLGWKDTLADPRNTARQRAYAQVRGDGKVYTPQVVVNGSLHVLGSDRAAIEQAITKSRAKYGAMSVAPVTLVFADGRVNVTIADGSPAEAKDAGAEIWLWGLAKAVAIAIGRGENKGREITYHNVLRRSIKLGDWTGKAGAWSVPAQKLEGDGIDTAVVLVQSGSEDKPRTILGATLAAIR
jgi:hypothetical protein